MKAATSRVLATILLAVPETCCAVFAQEGRVPPEPTVVHASLAAYPHAVISLKDGATDTIFYVESNGRRLVALNREGKISWSVDILQQVRIKPGAGEPVVRHLRLDGRTLWVTFGKSDTAKVDVRTGKVVYAGSD